MNTNLARKKPLNAKCYQKKKSIKYCKNSKPHTNPSESEGFV